MESKICKIPGGTLLSGTALSLLLSASPVSAQNTLTAMNTGSGQPLLSEVRSLFVDGLLFKPRLLFNLGFASNETLAFGTFLDSFTVTIQDPNQALTAVYLTLDIAGTRVAPATPGTLFIDPATISTDPLAYPNLSPVLFDQRAFAVSASIPEQFVGGQVNVYFDLFDNQNSIASQAWFSNLRVESVPEPQVLSLLLLAGGVMWGLRRTKS
jgi:hypothetical protein